jgi:hypothetical protein
MAALKITFDTNVLKGTVTPDSRIGEIDHADYVAVHEAVKSGRIRGYFSEAVIALDALYAPRKSNKLARRKDKVDIVGGTRFVTEAHATGPRTIEINIGARWPQRPPIDQQFCDLIYAALALGMRALIGPRHMGHCLSVQDFGENLYEPYPVGELVERADKTNEIDAVLARRGIGRSRAVGLGLEFIQRDSAGQSDTRGRPKWWPEGLQKAIDQTERKKVHDAINEWADGDAVAAHIGYGNDFFCTLESDSESSRLFKPWRYVGKVA